MILNALCWGFLPLAVSLLVSHAIGGGWAWGFFGPVGWVASAMNRSPKRPPWRGRRRANRPSQKPVKGKSAAKVGSQRDDEFPHITGCQIEKLDPETPAK